MRVVQHLNADSFLECTETWLLRAEAQHNLILGLARLLRGEPPPTRSTPWFFSLHEHGSVVGCALRTPPRDLLITELERSGVEALIGALHSELPSLSGVFGPEPGSGTFAAQWSKLQRRPSQPPMRQRFYVLRQVRPNLVEAPGSLRKATPSDLPRVADWVAQFTQETATGDSEDPQRIAGGAIAKGQLYLWQAPDPVSMAGWTGVTPSGRRVSFVFTPPAERRRGHASACVAALSRTILAMGNRFCCLYADLANPTSNAIYARIGYEPMYDASRYALAGSLLDKPA